MSTAERMWARYVGAGEHYEGIPARDLTAAELEGLTPARRALVESGRLYLLEDVSAADVPLIEEAPQEPAASGQAVEESENGR